MLHTDFLSSTITYSASHWPFINNYLQCFTLTCYHQQLLTVLPNDFLSSYSASHWLFFNQQLLTVLHADFLSTIIYSASHWLFFLSTKYLQCFTLTFYMNNYLQCFTLTFYQQLRTVLHTDFLLTITYSAPYWLFINNYVQYFTMNLYHQQLLNFLSSTITYSASHWFVLLLTITYSVSHWYFSYQQLLTVLQTDFFFIINNYLQCFKLNFYHKQLLPVLHTDLLSTITYSALHWLSIVSNYLWYFTLTFQSAIIYCASHWHFLAKNYLQCFTNDFYSQQLLTVLHIGFS